MRAVVACTAVAVDVLSALLPGTACALRAPTYSAGFGALAAGSENLDGTGFSLGRTQPLSGVVSWDTRLEALHLPSWSIENNLEMTTGRHGPVSGLLLDMGLDLHFPVNVGLSPFFGLRAGVGWMDWAKTTEPPNFGQTPETRAARKALAVTTGLELGLRVSSMRPWPTIRTSLGLQVVSSGRDGAIVSGIRASLGY